MGDYQPLRPVGSFGGGQFQQAYVPVNQGIGQSPGSPLYVASRRPFPILAVVLGIGAVLFILSIIGVFIVKNKKKSLKNEQKAIKSVKYLTKGNKLKNGKEDKTQKAKTEKDEKTQKAKTEKDEKTQKAKGAKEEKDTKAKDAKDQKGTKDPKGSGKSDFIDKNQPTVKSFNLKS